MAEFMKIIVDEQPMIVERNISLLQVLNDQKIVIPSLCYNAFLEAYGGCGLCIVEIFRNGAWEPQRACLLKTEEGLNIRTTSTRIRWLRSQAARLLLKHGPFNKKSVESLLIKLIKEGEGNTKPKHIYENLESYYETNINSVNSGCILCGLCIRMCRKVGKNQLVFLGRGKNLRVGLAAYDDELGACGRCRACSYICPTGFIAPDARQVFTANLYKNK